MSGSPSYKATKKLSLFESYLVSSFIASLFLWFSSLATQKEFLPNSFFYSLFVVGHWLFIERWPFSISGFKSRFESAGLFLFQVICLVGMAFSSSSQLITVMALVPCVCGTFYFFSGDKSTSLEDKTKGPGLFLIGVLSYLIFSSIGDRQLLSSEDLTVFFTFTVWVTLISYWGSMALSRSYKALMFNVYRRSKDQDQSNVENDSRERLFFHDIINQTHGMSLFLGNRTSATNGLTPEEAKNFEKEVKAIQSLIEDYFGYKHKNLVNTFGIIEFENIKPQILKLVENYFVSSKTDAHVIFQGGISDAVPMSKRHECKVHFASFYRILTNLVKNVSENNPSEVEFSFSFEENKLNLIVKNKVLHLKEDQGNLIKNLEGMILETHPSRSFNSDGSGLGLESISAMCEESGGSFRFMLEGDYWVNIVTLPNAAIDKSKKVAA